MECMARKQPILTPPNHRYSKAEIQPLNIDLLALQNGNINAEIKQLIKPNDSKYPTLIWLKSTNKPIKKIFGNTVNNQMLRVSTKRSKLERRLVFANNQLLK